VHRSDSGLGVDVPQLAYVKPTCTVLYCRWGEVGKGVGRAEARGSVEGMYRRRVQEGSAQDGIAFTSAEKC
jgi:hypothetical protein